MLRFQFHEMLVHIPDSPCVCITKDPSSVRRKTDALDHGQVHILASVADPLPDHVRGLVDCPGQHPIHDLLGRHLLGAILFE